MDIKDYLLIAIDYCRKHECWTCPLNQFSCCLPDMRTVDIVLEWSKYKKEGSR